MKNLKAIFTLIVLFVFVGFTQQVNAQEKENVDDNSNISKSSSKADIEKMFAGRKLFFMCRAMTQAKFRVVESSWPAFVKKVEKTAKESGVDIGENTHKFISDNIEKFKCINKTSVYIRKEPSIFKFAADMGDFKFIRDAMLLKSSRGGFICNPNIDFTKAEILPSGEKETLLDYVTKMVNDERMDAMHTMHDLKNLRRDIASCTNIDRKAWLAKLKKRKKL